MQKETHQRS